MRRNGPGLDCRRTFGDSVVAFDTSYPEARPVTRLFDVVAVTGPLRRGFCPALTGRGQAVWVPERSVRPRTATNVCTIERTRDGTLRHSYKYADGSGR